MFMLYKTKQNNDTVFFFACLFLFLNLHPTHPNCCTEVLRLSSSPGAKSLLTKALVCVYHSASSLAFFPCRVALSLFIYLLPSQT